jgi:AmmeMemoRadiSam system protein A
VNAGGGSGPRDPRGPALYARACVESLVGDAAPPQMPDEAFYRRPAACFVSIKKTGQLRGCIGTLEPSELTLDREIARNAIAAALHDPRFPSVRATELGELSYSVDVLSDTEAATLDHLDARRYGVIVSAGLRRGVLLPDLAGVEDAHQQVAIALQKAQIAPDEHFALERFTVDRYDEHE